MIILPAAIGDCVAHANIINYFLKHKQTIHLFARTSQTIFDDYPDIKVIHQLAESTPFRYRTLLDIESLPIHRVVSWRIAAERKVGGKRKNIQNWFIYNRRINRSEFQNIYADMVPFAEALGIPKAEAADWTIEAHHSSAEQAEVGIHIDASNPLRYIPTDLTRKIIEYLLLLNIPIRIYGQDAARLRIFLRDYPSLLYAPMHLSDLKSSLVKLRAVIAPDSGIAHLASALKTPLLAFYGPNLSKISGPIHFSALFEKDFPCRPCDQTKECPFDNRCLNTIEFSEVRFALEKLISRKS